MTNHMSSVQNPMRLLDWFPHDVLNLTDEPQEPFPPKPQESLLFSFSLDEMFGTNRAFRAMMCVNLH